MSAPAAAATRSTPRITGLSTRLLTVPLRRHWGAEAPENHVIVTELHTDDGGAGHGFSWTPTIGPQAVKALLDYDIAPFVSGLPANPEAVWDALWKRLHEAGGGGLTTIAMAGVDLALWDLQARRAGTSVTGLLGQRQELSAGKKLGWGALVLVVPVIGPFVYYFASGSKLSTRFKLALLMGAPVLLLVVTVLLMVLASYTLL